MRMEENASLHTIQNAIQAVGRGFDVNYDTRLLYCKGVAGSRLVEINAECRDLKVFDRFCVPGVSRDIGCSYEAGWRETTGACSFSEMAEFFNRKAQLSGNIPLGCFNSAFSFTGSKKIDSASTKSLAVDGKFIPLCKVELARGFLSLREDVRRAVPVSWEPLSLARFIENYGTHIITSVTIGGKDVIYVKQHSSSTLSTAEIKNYIQDIGDHRFSQNDSHSSGPIKLKDKDSPFSSQGIYPQPPNTPFLSAKEDVTVIFRRRGGDDLVQSHTQWAQTVIQAPDVIHMTFLPLTSLLEGVPGKNHLVRAINLFLEYKPPIEELRYFLEFQVNRVWAPIRDDNPARRRKEPVCPSLQFSMMGKKLYVSQEQVSVGRKPVTGLRLCLEGPKQNRLCIHIQHLFSLPKILQPYWDAHVAIGPPKWVGPEEQDSRWFEPVKWKNFSHVSTAPVEFTENLISDMSGIYIVTGAQLGVWDFGAKNVLYMKLLYSRVPRCTIRRSLWDHSPTGINSEDKRGQVSEELNEVGELGSSSGSGSGSGTGSGKLTRFVDMSEMCKGPDDSPGHWLVTGGKLGVDKGKVVLRVKYSLLNY